MTSASSNNPIVNVAVAVVQRSDGRVLLAERPKGKESGGYWEFPGGKFDAGEQAKQALTRELHEEIGVELDVAYPWLTYEHVYPNKTVRLHYFRVTAWHGTPHGREGQRVSWEDPAAVSVAPLLPANEKIMRALNLPLVYAITQAKRYGMNEFMVRLDEALARGVQLIQVREPDMAPAQLAQFARRVVARAQAFGATVLINGDETLTRKVGATGVHSSSSQLMRLSVRPNTRVWAASCHNLQQLERAARLGADFVVLSPVLPTATHPGVPGMGWAQFSELLHGYPLPVYALGGMKTDLLDTAITHGAHGVACSGDIW